MSEKPLYKRLLWASSVGLNLVIATFVGLGIGWLIDTKLFSGRTYPWFTIFFLLAGIASGFLEIVRTAKKEINEDN